MNFEDLLHILEDESLFESSLLLAGDVNSKNIRKQISRWTKTGRILQLRRGLYLLANPYRKKDPHPFHVANLMVRGSYVSLHSALSYYGMIPEFVATVTSVTTKRPNSWNTVLGRFEFRHIKTDFFKDYQLSSLGTDQQAFMATPEKALFDLLYLVPQSHTAAYLRELRLYFSEQFKLEKFVIKAEFSRSKKMIQAARVLQHMFDDERREVESL